MTTKTFYGLGSLASGAAYLAMQENGTAPSAAELSPITGLTPASGGTAAAVGDMSEFYAQVQRNATSFTSTTMPLTPDSTNGNGFRIPTALTGTFAAGNWTLSFAVIARSNNWNGRHRFRARVWRSTSATGTSPTEITASTQLTGATTANVVQNATDARTVTWSAPSITLSAEYLFFTVALEVTTAGTTQSGGRDLNLYGGPDTSVATTDFSVVSMTETVGIIPI